jgi:hypothetical protein
LRIVEGNVFYPSTGAQPLGEGRPAKGAPPLASWVQGCNPMRPLGPVLGAHAQGLLLGHPLLFWAFILQHHDEVELSCTGPSNWPRRWCRRRCCRCWSRRRCCWCRCTRGILIRFGVVFGRSVAASRTVRLGLVDGLPGVCGQSGQASRMVHPVLSDSLPGPVLSS